MPFTVDTSTQEVSAREPTTGKTALDLKALINAELARHGACDGIRCGRVFPTNNLGAGCNWDAELARPSKTPSACRRIFASVRARLRRLHHLIAE
jgi:hypothetical protein